MIDEGLRCSGTGSAMQRFANYRGHVDRKQHTENTWTVIRWKSDDLSDLCKKCTFEFNKWLKEEKE